MSTITMQERDEQFLALQKRMFDLQKKKGADYAETIDGLRNLRRRGIEGIVARMGDKLSRIESLTHPGKNYQVNDESIEDTLIDLANYSLLLIILKRNLDSQ